MPSIVYTTIRSSDGVSEYCGWNRRIECNKPFPGLPLSGKEAPVGTAVEIYNGPRCPVRTFYLQTHTGAVAYHLDPIIPDGGWFINPTPSERTYLDATEVPEQVRGLTKRQNWDNDYEGMLIPGLIVVVAQEIVAHVNAITSFEMAMAQFPGLIDHIIANRLLAVGLSSDHRQAVREEIATLLASPMK